MENPSVYIETTVISYLTAKPSRDLVVAAHQEITREWWEIALSLCRGFVSPVVIEEIARGDSDAAKRRLDSVANFQVLKVTPETNTLAEEYFARTQIPEKARADSAPPPVVFVSYSHDSPKHKEWVSNLATRLRKEGAESMGRAFVISPSGGIRSKPEAGKGLGASQEAPAPHWLLPRYHTALFFPAVPCRS